MMQLYGFHPATRGTVDHAQQEPISPAWQIWIMNFSAVVRIDYVSKVLSPLPSVRDAGPRRGSNGILPHAC